MKPRKVNVDRMRKVLRRGSPSRGTVRLIGGAWGGHRAELIRQPPRIKVGAQIYYRIDDPDTGAPLGAYACP